MKFVDKVVTFSEETPLKLIESIRPHIIVKGGDYKPADVVGNHLAEVKIFDYIDGHSTSKVLNEA